MAIRQFLDSNGLATYDAKIKTEIAKKPEIVELTQAEYDLLSNEEKHNGKIYFITDYVSNGTANLIIKGYYNSTDGKFYNEALFTTEVSNKSANYLYIDLGDNIIYSYSVSNGFTPLGSRIEVDSSLSASSENPVQNKVINTALAGKASASDVSNIQGVIPDTATTSNKLATANDIPSVSGKANKVASATEGDIAKLDSNGDLVDSGIASTDLVTKSSSTGLLKNDGTVDSNTYPSSTITSPANKQILEYNSTSAKWENKNKFTALTGTLDAGETELAFTNAAITATARFETYTEDIYLPLLDIIRENTTLTLTFPEQADDVNVKVLIYED